MNFPVYQKEVVTDCLISLNAILEDIAHAEPEYGCHFKVFTIEKKRETNEKNSNFIF